MATTTYKIKQPRVYIVEIEHEDDSIESIMLGVAFTKIEAQVFRGTFTRHSAMFPYYCRLYSQPVNLEHLDEPYYQNTQRKRTETGWINPKKGKTREAYQKLMADRKKV
jgi:hypothetical protein